MLKCLALWEGWVGEEINAKGQRLRWTSRKLENISIVKYFFFFFVSLSWELAQSCPTLCDPLDCSLPGFSVHGIFQARVLEWVAISFSRGSFWPRDQTQVSCIAGRRFTLWATREAGVAKTTLRLSPKFPGSGKSSHPCFISSRLSQGWRNQ